MKQLIILVVLAVAGYFAYQHFSDATIEDADMEEDAQIETGDLPPIPGDCERLAKDLKNAMYGAATGEVSVGQRNTADRKFRSCLRDADFSDAQINGSVAQIQERVEGYLKQDDGG